MNARAPFEHVLDTFDSRHENTLRRLWLVGDVHGEFRHIEATLSAARHANTLPTWLVFLGDLDIDRQPLRVVLEPMFALSLDLRVAFIPGNHDADSYAHWECLHDRGAAVALHGPSGSAGHLRYVLLPPALHALGFEPVDPRFLRLRGTPVSHVSGPYRRLNPLRVLSLLKPGAIQPRALEAAQLQFRSVRIWWRRHRQ